MTTLYLLYSVRIIPSQLVSKYYVNIIIMMINIMIINTFLGPDVLRDLEGVLTKFPNYYVIGVLVAPTFSEGRMDDEVLSSMKLI